MKPGTGSRRLNKAQIEQLLGGIHPRDREEALRVIEADYTELLYDTQDVYPVEIGPTRHLRFVPEVTKIQGAWVEKEFTWKEQVEARQNDARLLKRMGCTLEEYFEAPAVLNKK